MHRKVEENLANIEKPSSIYGTVEDMVNRAGVGRGGGDFWPRIWKGTWSTAHRERY